MADTFIYGAANNKSPAQLAREVGLEDDARHAKCLAGQPEKFTTNEGDEVILDCVSNAKEDAAAKEEKQQSTKSFLASSLEDNILSQYDNMAYNFRLFMTTEHATVETMPQENIIVIAETGSTGLNITDVDMNTIISPSQATKNTFATEINISIIEPFGTSFMDFVRNAALELGVKDHRNVPMWLDLRFKGYTTDGDNAQNAHEGGDTITLDSETRSWRIIVKNIDIEMNLGGTEYNLKCIAQDEASFNDSARRLSEDIQIDALTVGEFFEKLTKRLNKFFNYDSVLSKDKTQNIREYKFSLPPAKSSSVYKGSMGEWKIRGSKNINTVRNALTDIDGISRWRSTFKKGTAIDEIIQELIGSTEEGQSLLLFGEIGRKVKDKNPRDPNKPGVMFVVDPEIKLSSYNGIAKTYNLEITYNIREYKTFIPIVTREQMEIAKRSGKSDKLLEEKLKISNIKKKYDYMFTGKNTEVLDYKIKLNSAWFVSLPIYRGQNRNKHPEEGMLGNIEAANNRPEQSKNAPNAAPDPKSLDGILKKLETLNEQKDKVSGFGGIDAIAAANLSTDIEETTNEALVKGAKIDITSSRDLFKTSTFSAGEITARYQTIKNDNVSSELTVVDGKTIRIDNDSNRGSIFFVEDFGTLSDSKIVRSREEDINNTLNSVGAQVSPTATNQEKNIEGNDDEDRSFFSAIMNQVQGFKGQSIDLSLEIKGDPYWLGEPNIRKRLSGGNGHTDLTQTDSLLILSFMFPVSVDEDGSEHAYKGTGLYSLKRKENGFNGVYRVVSVENTFSDGKFTQKLTGYVDPLTKEQDLIKKLDEIDANGQ